MLAELFPILLEPHNTSMGQKWLMLNVTDIVILEDAKQCIAIRRGKKN